MRYFVLIGLILNLWWWTQTALARVTVVEVYPGNVFLEEEFSVKAGLNRLPLKAHLNNTSEIQVEPRGTQILVLSLEEALPAGTLAERLQKRRKELQGLEAQKKLLERKLSLLQTTLENQDSIPDPSILKQYFELYERLYSKLKDLEEQEKQLKKEIKKLEELLPRGRISVLRAEVLQPGHLVVRYPAPGLLSWRRFYRLDLVTQEKVVLLSGQAVLKQRSGEDWSGVEVRFYPRFEPGAILSPPPFKPWIIDLPQPLGLLKGKLEKLAAKLPLSPRREESPGALWERIVIEGVELPCGQETLIPLAHYRLPAKKILLEVPVYAVNKAYFRADVVPKISVPRTRADFYLDGTYVGQGSLEALSPGVKKAFYFGTAHLLEVKREILKDTSGHPLFSREREIIEKVFRTTLVNHYQRPFEVEVIDRIPIAKKKEIRIKASADPPWEELSPEGRAVWRFRLDPEARAKILLEIRINRPVEK